MLPLDIISDSTLCVLCMLLCLNDKHQPGMFVFLSMCFFYKLPTYITIISVILILIDTREF